MSKFKLIMIALVILGICCVSNASAQSVQPPVSHMESCPIMSADSPKPAPAKPDELTLAVFLGVPTIVLIATVGVIVLTKKKGNGTKNGKKTKITARSFPGNDTRSGGRQ